MQMDSRRNLRLSAAMPLHRKSPTILDPNFSIFNLSKLKQARAHFSTEKHEKEEHHRASFRYRKQDEICFPSHSKLQTFTRQTDIQFTSEAFVCGIEKFTTLEQHLEPHLGQNVQDLLQDSKVHLLEEDQTTPVDKDVVNLRIPEVSPFIMTDPWSSSADLVGVNDGKTLLTIDNVFLVLDTQKKKQDLQSAVKRHIQEKLTKKIPIPLIEVTLFRNWGGTYQGVMLLVKPKHREQVQVIVKEAAEMGIKIRGGGGYHSHSPIHPDNGNLMINTCDLKLPDGTRYKIDKTGNEEDWTITVSPGCNNADILIDMIKENVCFRSSVGLPTATFGGMLSGGCHGVGSDQTPMSDWIISMKVVDASGSVVTIPDPKASQEEQERVLRSARVNLGTFGIIVEMSIKIWPMEIVQVNHLLNKKFDMVLGRNGSLAKLLGEYWSLHIIWVPFSGLQFKVNNANAYSWKQGKDILYIIGKNCLYDKAPDKKIEDLRDLMVSEGLPDQASKEIISQIHSLFSQTRRTVQRKIQAICEEEELPEQTSERIVAGICDLVDRFPVQIAPRKIDQICELIDKARMPVKISNYLIAKVCNLFTPAILTSANSDDQISEDQIARICAEAGLPLYSPSNIKQICDTIEQAGLPTQTFEVVVSRMQDHRAVLPFLISREQIAQICEHGLPDRKEQDIIGRITDLMMRLKSKDIIHQILDVIATLNVLTAPDRLGQVNDLISQTRLGVLGDIMNHVQHTTPSLCSLAFESEFQNKENFSQRMLIPWALFFRDGLDFCYAYDMEFLFPMEIEHPTIVFDAVQVLREMVKERARFEPPKEKSSYPLNMFLELRFIRNSDSTISPASFSSSHTACIEIQSLYDAEDWKPFYAELAMKWVKLGGVPHWQKQWAFNPELMPILKEKYASKFEEFLDVRKSLKVDPNNVFMNKTLMELFSLE